MFVYSLYGNNIKNMKLGYNVYYVLFDLWYKWLLYIKSTLCSIFCLIYYRVVIKINLCQCQCTLGKWLMDFFYQYEYVVTETHKYCGCDHFYFFFKQIQNWFDNTIIMIIKHNEIYSLNN